jgi:TPR repeat protein
MDTPAPGNGTHPATTAPEDVTNELIRSASQLLDTGNVEAARELLRRAAERGSGPAALTLARSYEAQQVQAGVPAANETNSVLARVWYERAHALGVAQAEIQATSPDPRR